MSETTIEVHTSLVTRHLINRGADEPLIEEKTNTIVSRLGSRNAIKKFQLITRQIGKNSVTQRTEAGQVSQETKMSEQELKEFNTLWEKEWQPEIKDELMTPAVAL